MNNKLFKDTKSFTFLSIMLALTIFFTYTVGMIPTGMASMAVLVFFPTVLTSLIYGPKTGAFMGILAGIVAMSKNIIMPSGLLSPYFINPLVSVFPRMFIGIIPYYVYRLLDKIIKQKDIVAFISGMMGAVTNTAFAMTMLYLVYAKDIIAVTGKAFKAVLLGIITSSSVIEAIIMGIATFAVLKIYLMKKNTIAANIKKNI